MRHKGPPTAVTDNGRASVVATIDGRPRQAGDRYTLINQTPRPAAVASEMGHLRKSGSLSWHSLALRKLCMDFQLRRLHLEQ
jgi:hypothetical protein